MSLKKGWGNFIGFDWSKLKPGLFNFTVHPSASWQVLPVNGCGKIIFIGKWLKEKWDSMRMIQWFQSALFSLKPSSALFRYQCLGQWTWWWKPALDESLQMLTPTISTLSQSIVTMRRICRQMTSASTSGISRSLTAASVSLKTRVIRVCAWVETCQA